MIGRLRGTLIVKQAPVVMVEAGGVGYEIMMPINNFCHLPELGTEITIYTHFIVRENEQLLCGFLDEKQLMLFRALIKVTGVGPKLALTILSGVEPNALIQNILDNDATNLVKLPGIGQKTAQRLILELHDKLDHLPFAVSSTSAAPPTTTADAINALVALGYKPQEAQHAVAKHQHKQLSSEDLVRLALREI